MRNVYHTEPVVRATVLSSFLRRRSRWSLPVAILGLFMSVSGFSQSITIGGGTVNTNGTGADPIDGYFNAMRFQVVYTAAELTAAGLPSGSSLNGIGWGVSQDYGGPILNNYTVRLAHTTATNCATHNTAALTQVVNPFSYDPVVQTAGNYQMITFNTNFVWNGTDNILVDVCTGNANAYTSPYGGVRAINSANGSRYVRQDSGPGLCNTATDGTSGLFAYGSLGTKPEVRFNYLPPAPIDMTPISILSPVSGAPCYGAPQTITVRVRNNGSAILNLSTNPLTVNVNVTGPNPGSFNTVVNTGTIAVGATADVTVTTTYNMNAAGTYGFAASTSVTGDGYTPNDNLPAVNVTNTIGVTATVPSGTLCPNSVLNLLSSGSPYNTVILSENFNSGAPAWTTVNNSTGGTPANAAWTLRTSPYAIGGSWATSITSNDNSVFYFTDGDAPGSGSTTNTELHTPTFSTVGYSGLTLSFYHFYRDIADAGDNAYVEVTTDGGANWTAVQTYTATQGANNAFAQATLNLNAFINYPSVRIRFRFSCTWDWGWAIDNVVISGAASNYTYSWTSTPGTFTSTTQNPSTTVPTVNTIYTVSATSITGCTVTSTATVNVHPTINLSSTVTDVTCVGNDGAVNLTVSGGNPGYTFSWSNSATTEDISGVTPNTYTVTVTDANSCTQTGTATVGIQPGLLNLSSITPTHVTCFGGSTGAVDLTTTGGTGTITYAWSNSASTQDLSNVAAGTYSVVATDGMGCTVTASTTVTEPPVIGLTTTVTNVSCNAGSNGAINLTPAGGVGSFTFAWSNSASTEDQSGIPADTYSVVVTDGNGCTMTTSATVTEPAALGSSTAVTDVTCNGLSNGSIDLTVTGGTTGYTYSWSNSTSAQDPSNLPANTYSVIVTDANGCTLTTSATVTQPTTLTSSTTNSGVLCFGGSTGTATVTANGGTVNYSYLWSPAGGTNATTSGVPVGTYTVVVTDANGCTSSSTATISQPPMLTALIPNSTNISCNGLTDGSATVVAGFGTPGYTYSWSPSGGSAATASNLDNGSYTVTVTDNNGCTATSSVVITEPAQLTVTTGFTPETFNNSGAATCDPQGGTAPYSYSWNTGAQTQNLYSIPGGTYTVTVTDDNGCTTTATVTVPSFVGVDPSEDAGNVNLYPNPSNGQFTISVNGFAGGDFKIEIMDLSGKLIENQVLTNASESFSKSMDLTSMPNGTYLVRMVSDQGTIVRRVVVSH